MAAISVFDPRQEVEESQMIVHPTRHQLRSHPTTVVSIPFDVRFFTGAKLSRIITTNATSANRMNVPTTLRMPLGILTTLLSATGSADANIAALITEVNRLLVEQVSAGVVAGVAGGEGSRSLLRELKKCAFQWVCLPKSSGSTTTTTSIVRSIVDRVASPSSRNSVVDIVAVFRGRGGKGKAAFLARLERKGREYRRAVQMAAHTARHTGQAMTGAAATATRRTQAASLLTERVGQHNNRRGGDRAGRRAHMGGDVEGGGDASHRDIEAEADRNPNHPLAILRRKQERERLEIERLRGVAKSAVARGMMKLNQLEQAAGPSSSSAVSN